MDGCDGFPEYDRDKTNANYHSNDAFVEKVIRSY